MFRGSLWQHTLPRCWLPHCPRSHASGFVFAGWSRNPAAARAAVPSPCPPTTACFAGYPAPCSRMLIFTSCFIVYAAPQEVSAGPPAGFTLTESRGDTLMTLTKQHGGETITVDVMVNDQVGHWEGGWVG